MRKRIFLNDRGGGGFTNLPDGSSANTLDVVLYNFTSQKLEIVPNDKWSVSSYPKFNNTSKPENSTSGFYPVGIVVIPGSHGVLKDGMGKKNQCGIMSLVPMNYSTPEKGGTTNQYMYWGSDEMDISGKSDNLGRSDSTGDGLINYELVNQVGYYGNLTATLQGTTSGAYLPSDAFSMDKNPYDDKTWYNTENYYYAPSPYNNDGSFNSIYSQTTSPASERNALSDFNGIVNTKILTDLVTGQSDWRTANTIINYMEVGYHPVACCCARFKTTGTKAFVECTTNELRNGTGFWYMPAIGELGYVVVRRKTIDSTISKLRSAYGVGVQVGDDNSYWSSSEYNRVYARGIETNSGCVSGFLKTYTYSSYVRAFLRL